MKFLIKNIFTLIKKKYLYKFDNLLLKLQIQFKNY